MPVLRLALFTLSRWIVCIVLVLQNLVQRALNRRFMQWFGELVRRVTRSTSQQDEGRSEGVEEDDSALQHGKSNKEIFEDLKNDSGSEWGPFFRLELKYELKTHHRRPIGKGSEAKIFKATRTGRNSTQLAVKIYSKGNSLRDLQKLWPRELFKVAIQHELLSLLNVNLCLPLSATVLEDDRFAFIFPRFGGDLRHLINFRMERNNGGHTGRPFSPSYTFSILHNIAKGMELLHSMGFLHRDLKAANVLYPQGEKNRCDDHSSISSLFIADFESSNNTVGTGFWRAPEILLRLRDHLPVTFTRLADVYSYAMTCYEVLTGHVPLASKSLRDYDFVIGGGRPELPEDTIPALGELVKRCWHEDPLERPTFAAIVGHLESIGQEYNLAHCDQYVKQKKHARGSKSWLGELIQHASLSPMHHQKPDKMSKDLETNCVKLRRLKKSTGREDDLTKQHHKTSNKETFEDLKNGKSLKPFSGFRFQALFLHSRVKYELGTHHRRSTGKRSRTKDYKGSGTMHCSRARFHSGFIVKDRQRDVELSERQWLVRRFPLFIKVTLKPAVVVTHDT